jgi:hypothetical protein
MKHGQFSFLLESAHTIHPTSFALSTPALRRTDR